MPKHTPGPWEIERYEDRECGGGEDWFRITGESTLFVELHACADGYQPGQNEANARLIAAAPDLLKACREALYCLTSGDRTMWEDPESPYHFLGSAIAKATS